MPVRLQDEISHGETRCVQILAVSAKTGEGIPELCRAIAKTLEGAGAENGVAAGSGGGANGGESEDTGPGTLRQKELIDAALDSTEEALALAGKAGPDEPAPLDIIAPLLRAAVDALGEITGEVSTADILETMFSRFCVGK
jgi:tRNA modification GTPase